MLPHLTFFAHHSRYFLKYMLKRRDLLDGVRMLFPEDGGPPDPFIIAELDRALDRINAIRGQSVL